MIQTQLTNMNETNNKNDSINKTTDAMLLELLNTDPMVIDTNNNKLKIYNDHMKKVVDEMSTEIKKWLENTFKYASYLEKKYSEILEDKDRNVNMYNTLLKYKLENPSKIDNTKLKILNNYELYFTVCDTKIEEILQKINLTKEILSKRSDTLTFLSKNKNKMLVIDNLFFELKKMLRNNKPSKPIDILRKQFELDKSIHELFMCNYNLHKEIHQL